MQGLKRAAAGKVARDAAASAMPAGGVSETHTKPVSDDEDNEDENEDGEKKKKSKEETQVWEWLDDLLEGFAFIYANTVATGHVCTDCVRKNVYPLKEKLVETFDSGVSQVRPNTDQRMGNGGLGISAHGQRW